MKIFDLVKQFTSEITHYVKNGMPNVSASEYQDRLEACNTCPHKKESTCGLCGCVIALKAKMATSDCPDDPPRWPEIKENESQKELREARQKEAEERAAKIKEVYERELKLNREILQKMGPSLKSPVELNAKKIQEAKDKINKSSQKQKKK